MLLQDWLTSRNLSMSMVKRGEEFHHLLKNTALGPRHVVRLMSVESLDAYRRLPQSVRVDVVDTSQPFVRDGRPAVFVEYVEDGLFSTLELTASKRDPPQMYLAAGCVIARALLMRQLVLSRLQESCIEIDRTKPGFVLEGAFKESSGLICSSSFRWSPSPAPVR